MLPPKQKEILDYINKYQQIHGYGPTLDAIAQKFQKAVPTIYQHVQALRAKGYLKSPGSNARSVGVFDSNEEVVEIPLMGFVSAGGGIENIETPEPIKVQRSLLSPRGEHYALIVRGTSMIEDGIFPDDIVVVKYQNYADNGDVVIALIEENGTSLATVKRFYHHGNKIELRPRNPELQPRWFDIGSVELRGKFVGLLRKG